MKSSQRPDRLCFEDRELKILEAATRLFSKKGFGGTTTKSIAKEAGINEALLYRHFSTKKKLYSALIEKKMVEWRVETQPVLEKAFKLPLKEAILLIMKTIIQEKRRRPHHLRIVLFAALENHPISRFFFIPKPPILEFLELFAEHHAQEGTLKTNVESFARGLLAFIMNEIFVLEIFKVRPHDPKSELEILKNYTDLLLKGCT